MPFLRAANTLRESVWLLMPASEEEVFDALSGGGSRSLKEFTLTRSGGFQGCATDLDDVFVLRADGGSSEVLRLIPHGGGEPVEIERALLRPWLFGKDVERLVCRLGGLVRRLPLCRDRR